MRQANFASRGWVRCRVCHVALSSRHPGLGEDVRAALDVFTASTARIAGECREGRLVLSAQSVEPVHGLEPLTFVHDNQSRTGSYAFGGPAGIRLREPRTIDWGRRFNG